MAGSRPTAATPAIASSLSGAVERHHDPHCSGWTEGMVVRRWNEVADNINRFIRGEPLKNVVFTT
jgi:hypothetical protein